MVSSVRKNRSVLENDREDQFVYIEKKLLNEISEVFAQKSKI